MALLCLTPSLVHAQEEDSTFAQQIHKRVKNEDSQNIFNLSVENDMFGGGSDRFYTSGVRLSWMNVQRQTPRPIQKVADKTPLFDRDETTSVVYSIGQNIYTPEDITIRANQEGDRPWAAFLYGSVGLTTVQDNHIDEMEVTLGVVGPEALGEQAQKFIHRHISDSDMPKGWSNQLEFEPALILSAQRRWPGALQTSLDAKVSDYYLGLTPHVNFSLGNIYTYAGTGFTLAFSPLKDRFQDTPPRVRPAIPGTGYFTAPSHSFTWQLFTGVEARAVARNIFLDGNTFHDSYSVDKKPFVIDANAGVALTWKDYRLSYSLNMRSREFDGQDGESVFGSINLSTRF